MKSLSLSISCVPSSPLSTSRAVSATLGVCSSVVPSSYVGAERHRSRTMARAPVHSGAISSSSSAAAAAGGVAEAAPPAPTPAPPKRAGRLQPIARPFTEVTSCVIRGNAGRGQPDEGGPARGGPEKMSSKHIALVRCE